MDIKLFPIVEPTGFFFDCFLAAQLTNGDRLDIHISSVAVSKTKNYSRLLFVL